MLETPPAELRIKNFDEDITNGLIFKTILENYIGMLAPVSRELQQFRNSFNSK